MKLALIVLFAIQTLFSIAHASEDCHRLLSDHISSAIQNLAELRKDLDLKIATGDVSMIVSALEGAFKQKQKEILALGLSKTELEQRLKEEIQKSSSSPLDSKLNVAQVQTARALAVEDHLEKSVPLPIKRFYPSTVSLGDGKLMFLGGVTKRNLITADDYITQIEVLDTKTNQVETWAEKCVGRNQPKFHQLSDGRIVVWGGIKYNGKVSEVEFIDPASKTVTLAKFYLDSEMAGAAFTGIVIQDKLLLDQTNGTVFLWNPLNGEKQKFKIHERRQYSGISQFDEESIIVSGGSFDGSLNFGVYQFHFPTETLTSLYDLVKASAGHTQLTTPKNKILTFGGRVFGATQTDIQLFDPEKKSGELVGHLSGPRTGGLTLPLSDKYALIYGGLDSKQANKTVSTLELLNLELGTAEVIGYIDSGASMLSAVLQPDQTVLLVTSTDSGLALQRLKIGER